jgi:hypothetical protein
MGRSLRDKSLISCFIDYILTQIRLHCGIYTLIQTNPPKKLQLGPLINDIFYNPQQLRNLA